MKIFADFYSPGEGGSTLDNALLEIKDAIGGIAHSDSINSDPLFKSLCGELDRQFGAISKLIYECAEVDTDTLQANQSNPFLANFLSPMNSSPYLSSKKRFIYPYPTDYIDQIFCSAGMKCSFKILPYLLSCYYMNYKINGTVNIDGPSKSDADYNIFNANILDGAAPPPNFSRNLTTFCTYFSTERTSSLLNRCRGSRNKKFQAIVSPEKLVEFFNHSGFTSLHYQQMLWAYVYSLCVLSCNHVSELSCKIDYAFSAGLYNERTLAFETKYVADATFSLRDCFDTDFITAYIEENTMSNGTPDWANYGFLSSDFIPGAGLSVPEIALRVPMLFCWMFHPKNHPVFSCRKALHDSLDLERPPYVYGDTNW